MFGKFDTKAIIEGHLKELTNQENMLYKERIAICKECPLFSDSLMGYICDGSKCLGPDGNIYKYPVTGSTCGCGCRLSAKTRLPNAHCVLNKW